MATLHAFDERIGDRVITANTSANVGTPFWDVELGDITVSNNIVAPPAAGKPVWTELGTKIYTGP